MNEEGARGEENKTKIRQSDKDTKKHRRSNRIKNHKAISNTAAHIHNP